MRYVFGVIALAALAACGADGEPLTPRVNSSVTLNQNGINIGSNVAVRKGPFNLNLGLGL